VPSATEGGNHADHDAQGDHDHNHDHDHDEARAALTRPQTIARLRCPLERGVGVSHPKEE
jgi:hypothetical protein